jgi:hypothetical protein
VTNRSSSRRFDSERRPLRDFSSNRGAGTRPARCRRICPNMPPVASLFGMAVGVQPTQQTPNAGARQRDARIRSTVVEIDRVPIGFHRIATREHNVLNIPVPFVVRLWSEHPGIASNQAFFGLFKIKEREAKPIDGA